jgi:hypothetical protein
LVLLIDSSGWLKALRSSGDSGVRGVAAQAGPADTAQPAATMAERTAALRQTAR